MKRPVISRYLSPIIFTAVQSDLGFLVKRIKESGFEYSLEIRDDYLNLYYKGNSIGKISYKEGQKVYEIKIHRKFIVDRIIKRFSPKIIGNYITFILSNKQLHSLFSSKNLLSMGQMVKAIQFQEEIVFEQMLITDNANRDDLIIIDRQVVDRNSSTKMDLLAIKQTESSKYQFCIIEVKLGNNQELKEDVFYQLKEYVERITKNFSQYKTSYKRSIIQKQELGLLPNNLKIEIVEGVLGIVVVGGYSGLAQKNISELKAKHPDIKVLHITNEIKFENII